MQYFHHFSFPEVTRVTSSLTVPNAQYHDYDTEVAGSPFTFWSRIEDDLSSHKFYHPPCASIKTFETTADDARAQVAGM